MNGEKQVAYGDRDHQRGYSQIPNTLLRDRRVSAMARFLFVMLDSFAMEADQCFPGQERLASNLGISQPTLRKYLQELEAQGCITVTRRGLGKPNLYRLWLGRDRSQNIAGLSENGLRSDRKNLPPNKNQFEQKPGEQKERPLRRSPKEIEAREWAGRMAEALGVDPKEVFGDSR